MKFKIFASMAILTSFLSLNTYSYHEENVFYWLEELGNTCPGCFDDTTYSSATFKTINISQSETLLEIELELSKLETRSMEAKINVPDAISIRTENFNPTDSAWDHYYINGRMPERAQITLRYKNNKTCISSAACMFGRYEWLSDGELREISCGSVNSDKYYKGYHFICSDGEIFSMKPARQWLKFQGVVK